VWMERSIALGPQYHGRDRNAISKAARRETRSSQARAVARPLTSSMRWVRSGMVGSTAKRATRQRLSEEPGRGRGASVSERGVAVPVNWGVWLSRDSGSPDSTRHRS